MTYTDVPFSEAELVALSRWMHLEQRAIDLECLREAALDADDRPWADLLETQRAIAQRDSDHYYGEYLALRG